MLAMVGLLCLVMVTIQLAARPESWHWVVPPNADTAENSVPATIPTLEHLDFRVQEGPPGPPGTDGFHAIADDEAEPQGSSDEAVSRSDAITSAEIPAELLAGIEDNTLGVRRSEVDAYYAMLARMHNLSDTQLVLARDDVAFTVLMLQPDQFRGRLVTLTGHLHRLTPFPVDPDNAFGITQLYEGWMTTSDSGNNLFRFLCTELPAGVSPEEALGPLPVRVTGYFFKRYGYASLGGMHVAPTILARTFHVLPVLMSQSPSSSQMSQYVLGFFGLMAMALGVACWRTRISDLRYEQGRLKQLAAARLDARPDDLAALKDVPTSEPGEFLQQMAADDPAT